MSALAGSRLRHVDPHEPESGPLLEAIQALERGQAIVIPTETVYGIAVDPSVPGALPALYRAKGRQPDKPVALFVPGMDAVEQSGVKVNPLARRLAEAFWPGPLTLVLAGTEGTRGFRCPNHPVPRALLSRMGRALAVSSANRSGEPDTCSAPEAAASLGDRVALILDAGLAPGGIASTVVRVEGDRWEILREGALSRSSVTAKLAP